jgi:single-stranded DNA-binding protein
MAIEAALFGTLTRDAETKTSHAGKPYLRITGMRVGDTDKAQWVSIVAFDQDAIASAGKFVKGARVYVEGRLTLDKWKATDGGDRSGLSVLSFHCRLAQIGRNKTKPRRPIATSPSTIAAPARAGAHADFKDEIPGWTP